MSGSMNLNEAVQNLQAEHKRLCADAKAKPEHYLELERRYNILLDLNPADPRLQFSLGTLMMQMERSGLALNLFQRSIQDEKNRALGAAPWLNMAAAWKCEHRDKKAAECYLKAIEEAEKHPAINSKGVNDHMTSALHGMASLYVNAGEPQKCLEWADKGLKIDPTDRFALWNRGLALLELGQWAEGFDLYDRAGFMKSELKPIERKLKTYGLPRWNGEKGKTVVVTGEQGIGDEVMFSSIIPDLLKDCKVILDCDKRLVNLYKRAFPDAVEVYGTSGIDEPTPWLKDHAVDGYLPMGSLGMYYRRKSDDFPKKRFLMPDVDKSIRWNSELDKFDGLKIGFSWAGGLKKTRFDQRTIVLDEWAEVFKTPGCHFWSLQYHSFAADECARVSTAIGVPLHHWGDVVAEYDETAAFVSELDLVITVNTSLHHLCGALGVPQWCLTPKMVAWRYGIEGPSPWYGNCKMIRQKEPNDWKPAMVVVKRKLDRLLNVERVAEAA